MYVVPAVAVTLIALIFIIIRLERDSSRYLRLGDQSVRSGRTAEALFYWKMSLLMYVPYSPASRQAGERIRATAVASLERGDVETAARAFGYLRSGLLGIRHIAQPMPDLLLDAEKHLIVLRPSVSRDTEDSRFRPGGSALAGTALLCAGFLAWPISFFWMLHGWGKFGRPLQPRYALPGTISLLMLAAGALLA